MLTDAKVYTTPIKITANLQLRPDLQLLEYTCSDALWDEYLTERGLTLPDMDALPEPRVNAMKARLFGLLAAALTAIAWPAAAHHSFAIYDMSQNIEFEGVVETLKMRNPHMALTLMQTKPDGTKQTINFVEGAPANMIVRMGLNPARCRSRQAHQGDRRAAARRSECLSS